MKAKMLKIAGVKSDKEFYKKFPDEASFMKAHGKEFKKAMRGSKIERAQMGFDVTGTMTGPQLTPTAQNLQQQQMNWGQNFSNQPTPNQSWGTSDKKVNWAQGIPIVQNIVKGVQKLKEERDQLREARQMNQLVDVQAVAAESRSKQLPRHQYFRPEDVVYQPGQFNKPYGEGTNPLAQDGAVIRDNIGGNPTEIMNVYNPGTMYTDLGYEPLNDTEKMKQFLKGGKIPMAQTGFETFMNQQGGNEIASAIGQIPGLNSGGGDVGAGIGEAVGSIVPIPGAKKAFELAGRVFGSALDQKQKKIKAAQKRTQQSISNIIGQSTGLNIQNQFSSYMQNGGTTSPYEWVSHTWQPQVIATFGEHKMSDLLKPPQDADMLRAGGHLKEYTPPSAEAMFTGRPQFAMGGDLNVHWGGYVAPTAQNPFLPGDGIQMEGFGQSHNESDGKGNTGIGIDFHGNKVEIERKEPIVKLRDGGTGDENLTVFGNIIVKDPLAKLLDNRKVDNKDIAGMKFKHIVKLIGDKTNKQNKLIEKSSEGIDNLDVLSPFDQLALGTYNANIIGGNAKLKAYAAMTEDLAHLQNAVNTTEEEGLLGITDNGDVKTAKKGANIPKAQYGTVAGRRARGARSLDAPVPQGYLTLPTQPDAHDELAYSNPIFSYGAQPGLLPYEMAAGNPPITQESPITQAPTPGRATSRQIAAASTKDDYESRYGLSPWKGNRTGLGLATASELTTREWDQVADALGFKGRGNEEFQKFLLDNPKSKPLIERRHQTLYGKSPFVDSKLGAGWEGVAELIRPKTGSMDRTLRSIPSIAPAVISPSATPSKTVSTTPTTSKQGFDWMTAFNQVLPYLRPSDVENLDPNQIMGELYALSQNQVEPVWAQKIQPELGVPYDISLQDILNANQADYNATQRQVGYNPAALASLNAQKYAANQKVLGEQFRLNQAEKDKVYSENRNLLNQAKLQNMAILDKQYERQATALSKTKATTQAALNSIASKYAQNKLENRKLAVMENLYNYRYDPRFRLQNYQMAQFNTPTITSTTAKSGKSVNKKHFNSSVVKSLKNI